MRVVGRYRATIKMKRGPFLLGKNFLTLGAARGAADIADCLAGNLPFNSTGRSDSSQSIEITKEKDNDMNNFRIQSWKMRLLTEREVSQ